jgi:tetrapyrrole methylase family protein/MazG family protein
MSRTVVFSGSGIKSLSHLTSETISTVKDADLVAYLLNNSVLENWVKSVQENTYSLASEYAISNDRAVSYRAISDKIISLSKEHLNLCVLIYGHPLLISNSVQSAIKNLKQEGADVVVLPAVSSLDCLFADLCIDPIAGGVLALDASDWLLSKKTIDSSYHFILFQIGLLEIFELPTKNSTQESLLKLKEQLLKTYDRNHKVIIYEASIYPHLKAKIIESTINNLPILTLSNLSTLYIPPE